MSIKIICPCCGASIKAPDHVVGKQVKCPKCGSGFLVPPVEDELVLDEQPIIVQKPTPPPAVASRRGPTIAGGCLLVVVAIADPKAPRPAAGILRKDYVYLFERYFYFLEPLPLRERGLVVFDELEKSKAHGLLQQMAAYFLGHEDGPYRSSRIVPEPFFVHSDLRTGVFWLI